MMLDLADGKGVTVSADLGTIWLQIFANRGSLGIALDRKAASQLRTALLTAIIKIEESANG